MTTHYDILGVPTDATTDDIKRAYREFSRRHHPDLAGPESSARFAEGTSAYTTLVDPHHRAAYDQSLASPEPATEPDDPLDSWADSTDDTSWGASDEPPNTSPPPPTPTPPPPGATPSETVSGTGEDLRVTDAVPNPLVPAAAGLVAGTMTALVAPLSAVTCLVVTLVGMVAIAAQTVYAAAKAGPDDVGVRLITRTLWVALAAIGVTAIASSVFMECVAHSTPPWLVPPALTGAVTAALVTPIIVTGRANSKIIKSKVLRTHELFGVTPPGYAPAVMNQAIMTYLAAHPAARLFQLPDPAMFFSHAVVEGESVALLRSIGGPSGAYQWSGASLWHRTNATFSAPLEGDYVEALKRLRSAIKVKGTVTAAVVIVRQPADQGAVSSLPPFEGYPDIITDREVGTFLDATFREERNPHLIRRDVFCDTARAMVSQLS